MNEFIKLVLGRYNFSEQKLEKFSTELGEVVFNLLISESKDKLSEQDGMEIDKFVKEKNLDPVFQLLKSKYSASDWQALIDTKVGPLLESYITEVAQAA